MSKKFLTVVGARPQLIKLDKELSQVLVYTGQHYSESLKDIYFKGLKLPKPDYDLGVTDLGAMIDKLIVILNKEKPNYVIVYGDTRSTLAGAIAAKVVDIPLIHIEAGCRSFNDKMLEERIRTIVDEVSLIHFAPSLRCKEYLELDNTKVNVYNVGATQIDAMYSTFPTKKPKDAYGYVVATIHRAENLNKQKLENIFAGLKEAMFQVRLYLHPHTEQFIKQHKIKVPKNIRVLEPIPYKKMINEMAFADRIVTDSGGMQVEAFFLKRPCVTLRNETEWTETVDQRWNVLVGTDVEKIKKAVTDVFPRGDGDMYVYGGGDARKKIRLILENL